MRNFRSGISSKKLVSSFPSSEHLKNITFLLLVHMRFPRLLKWELAQQNHNSVFKFHSSGYYYATYRPFQNATCNPEPRFTCWRGYYLKSWQCTEQDVGHKGFTPRGFHAGFTRPKEKTNLDLTANNTAPVSRLIQIRETWAVKTILAKYAEFFHPSGKLYCPNRMIKQF